MYLKKLAIYQEFLNKIQKQTIQKQTLHFLYEVMLVYRETTSRVTKIVLGSMFLCLSISCRKAVVS